jgi:2-oxoglutarate ferredoxin oxidoreductase subunit beta
MRRGVNMTYILENNGVYGLTKGQFSATADKGSKAKKGAVNSEAPVDTVSLALLMGATFVGRSFSGDKKQLTPLIKAAIAHPGAAFIDVISPCVAFNNHPGSTKSYDYVREHNEAVNRLDFWPSRDAITVDYSQGGVIEVPQHDGSIIKLRKLDAEYDPSDKINAVSHIARAAQKGEVLTGLLYLAPDAEDLHAHLNTYEAPFNRLGEKELCPGAGMLEKINAAMR